VSTPYDTQSEPAASAPPARQRSLLHWLKSLDPRPAARTVVDLDDPVGSAIKDAEVLMAFAAQSAHVMDEKNLTVLTTSIAQLNAKRRSREEPTADELTRFWIAYDVLGNNMAPLSALSIRSSMRLNAKRFPASLFTATGMNAMFAIIVFLACILLQGFWGAGRELLDKAEALDAQKTELALRIQAADSILQRRESQGQILWNAIERLQPPATQGDSKLGIKTPQPSAVERDELAKLQAELNLAQAEHTEKRILTAELYAELGRLNERSRAVEDVISSWNRQTTTWCNRSLLKILCPIREASETDLKNAKMKEMEKLNSDSDSGLNRLEIAKKEVHRVEEEIKKLKAADKAASAPGQKASEPDSGRPFAGRGGPDSRAPPQSPAEKLADDKLDAMQKVELAEADSLRATLLNVRLTLANIANYLIPMLMGLLGALAFILRALTIQLREHTYVHMSASLSVVRMCLGAVAGVFGTLLAPVSDGTLKGLPPLIIPFVFGYGIEILFSIMDRVVGSFTQADGPKTGDKAHV
jgi:hypothetical protein